MSERIGRANVVSVFTLLLIAAIATPVSAQVGYPSFQQPRTVTREYNILIADGDGLTPVVFQWREGLAAGSQLSFDAGIADPESENADLFLLLGGQYARQLALARPDMPLDFLFTAGLFGMFGNDLTFVSIPVGVSLGHRFPIEGTSMAITPFAHPRLSLDYASANDESETDLAVNFDLGGSLELNQTISLRVSATFGDIDALGISMAFSPRGLRTASGARTIAR
jgi:hypothetical protein